MKERPILFSGEMVRAILDGRKTQTRRVVKGIKPNESIGRVGDVWEVASHIPGVDGEPQYHLNCPYGAVGDRLWVREAWSGLHAFRDTPPSERKSFVGDGVPYLHDEVWYWADGDPEFGDWEPPRPSIHMPRWGSRIDLEITEVRVERLQDISEEDAKAEGCNSYPETDTYGGSDAGDEFRSLWNSINADRGFCWDANPWVWVVSFEPTKK